MDDTLDLREQLGRAWRTTLDAAIANGAPSRAVIETMAAVAHERFAEAFGPVAAASYLQLLAEQMRDLERGETDFLVRGDAPTSPAPFAAEAGIDPAWLTGDEPSA